MSSLDSRGKISEYTLSGSRAAHLFVQGYKFAAVIMLVIVHVIVYFKRIKFSYVTETEYLY